MIKVCKCPYCIILKKMYNKNVHIKGEIIHRGFTLAEVLITIGIIGVVAAMTMPSLNQKISDQKNMSSLKKTYSVLQQATNLVIADNEGPEYWGMVDNNNEVVTQIYKYYKPHFNMMRECQNSEGCWAYPTKYLNGSVYWAAHNTSWCQFAFTLPDGVNILMDIYPASQIKADFGMGNTVDYDCLVFWVDVNADRLPNQIGRDIFAFIVTHKGLQPAGLGITGDGDCRSGGNGWTCTAKIIQDGWTIKYLK